jgi:large conductance mechanosensitive channel
MLKGLKGFIARGNIIDLAIAVVIGAAFGAVVSSFAGSTVTALINFLIIAGVIYFVIVYPMSELSRRRSKDADAMTPAPSDEAVLLTEIRDLLRERSRA